MRRAVKFLHTLAACGMVGALLAYATVLIAAPQDTPHAYAGMRQTVSALCSYLLLPSMALALISGLLSMVVHKPFMDQRWVWVKAVSGISVFEATLGIVGSKAGTAAAVSAKIAAGAPAADELARAIAHEWMALGVILALLLVNIILGIWRPRLIIRWFSWV